MTVRCFGAKRILVMKIAAFFDVDKTILSDNTGTLYLKYLARKGLVSRLEVWRSRYWFIKYRMNLVDMETLSRRIMLEYKGKPEKEIEDTSRQWFEDMGRNYIYPEIKQLIEKHRVAGHVLLVITAGTRYTAGPIAEFLGIRHALCTILRVENSYFTGELINPICYGKGKVHWAIKFADEHGIDLKNSFFYTDSITDMPLLEEVGNRGIVNPDPIIRRVAAKRGWRVFEFKK